MREQSLKLSELVSQYYEECTDIIDFSMYAYQRSFMKNVYPYLQDPSIQNIKEEDVRGLITHMKESLAPNSAWGIFRELRKIFNYAVENEYLDTNPFLAIDFRYIPIHQEAYTPEELAKIEEAIKDTSLYQMYRFAIATGMRLTEMIVLSWDNIDFENKIICIEYRAYRVQTPGRKINVQREGITYPITPKTEKILEDCLAYQNRIDKPRDYVFVTPHGGHVSHQEIEANNRYVREKTGLKDFNFRRITSHVKAVNADGKQ